VTIGCEMKNNTHLTHNIYSKLNYYNLNLNWDPRDKFLWIIIQLTKTIYETSYINFGYHTGNEEKFRGRGSVTSRWSHSPIRRLSPNTLLSHSILRASQQQKCFLCFLCYTTPAHPTLIDTHCRSAGCSLLTLMERSSSNLSVFNRETSLTGCSVILETLQNSFNRVLGTTKYSDESPTF
jgi:hypothetical protein